MASIAWSNPHVQGGMAYGNGESLAANPYHVDAEHVAWNMWRDGWLESYTFAQWVIRWGRDDERR